MKRSVTLDVMRGLAAVCIVLFHYTSAYYDKPEYSLSIVTYNGWEAWWGYAAVATFFMLSGYLASGHIIGKKLSPGRFIVKKARRFYPVFWVSMTVTTIFLLLFTTDQRIGIVQYIANLTMVSQLFRVPFIDGVYWSMQCELMFCLICALFIFLPSQRALTKALYIWILAAILLSFTLDMKAFRLFRIISIGSYCHDFVAGIVIYRLQRASIPRRQAIYLLVLCAVNSVCWHGLLSPATAFFIVSALLLLAVARLDKVIPAANPIVKIIIWIAAISYPLYLVHEMIGFITLRHLHLHGITHPLAAAVPIVLSLAIAAAIHHFVEKKIK